MQKISTWLGFRKLDTKAICTLGLFIALTVVFTLYFTLRIDTKIEISFNFIPTFIIGALFGPLYAGITYLLADIISVIAVPLGPPIPGLSITAFISGFIYGIFFHRNYKMSKSYVVRMVVCVLLQFVLSVLVNSFVLYHAYGSNNLTFWIAYRFPASFIKIFLQAAVIMFAPHYLKIFSKFTK